MAYLPQTSQVYAHGNMGMGTWRWDGNEWLQVADNGPDKSLQALVCDEQRQRLLLFEGETGVTWEFNGDIWQAVTSIGPGKGVNAQITFDGNHVVALVNQNLGDHLERRGTWSWEAGRWKQVENMGPGPRIDMALAGNIDTARTVLFGGSGHVVDGAGMLGDTWEFGVYPPGP